MNLSDIVEMANKYWLETPEHFPFVISNNHIVMPYHIDRLIEIAKNDKTYPVETQDFAFLPSSSKPSFPSSPIATGSFNKNQLKFTTRINGSFYNL